MPRSSRDLELAISVHSQLLKIVEPATADTIRSSLLRNNKPLMAIAIFGFIGLAILIGTSFYELNNTVPIRISGALLGATLYAFWTARTFLRERTFSHSYSQDYIIRFGIGVVAGFILGSILTEGSDTEGASEALKSASQQFGPFTLAVVGGFSAEAVVQILKRIAEVLVTTIRGTERDQAKAEAETRATRTLNQTASDLLQASQGKSRDEISENVEEIARGLLKSNVP